jgi:hypothetical protein
MDLESGWGMHVKKVHNLWGFFPRDKAYFRYVVVCRYGIVFIELGVLLSFFLPSWPSDSNGTPIYRAGYSLIAVSAFLLSHGAAQFFIT